MALKVCKRASKEGRELLDSTTYSKTDSSSCQRTMSCIIWFLTQMYGEVLYTKDVRPLGLEGIVYPRFGQQDMFYV